MRLALVGMNDEGAAVDRITDGLEAFWGALALAPAVAFSGATVVVAPPHASFFDDLNDTATANVLEEKTLAEAMHSIASDMHASAIIGGKATITMVETAIL